MLEVFVKFLCSIIMTYTGLYFIKKVLNIEKTVLSAKTSLIVIIMSLVTVIINTTHYTTMYTVIVFIINAIGYKGIFRLRFEQSVISTGILMFFTFLSELILSLVLVNFVSAIEIKENNLLYLLANILIAAFVIFIINRNYIKKQLSNFYYGIINNKSVLSTVFVVLFTIETSYLAYNLAANYNWNMQYITNVSITIFLIVITVIFLINSNNYNKLSHEYDNLFSYIQNFEEWIEKEQLNRHEYKNQLAVLRCLTNDKKVKGKIDEILEDNINLEGEVIQELKDLPKGGLKGLMYYKTIIAQKNQVLLTFDVSISKKSNINKLSEKQMNILCKLVGIYFDNAIEGASETRKRNVLVEVYDLKDKANIVISNTFKKDKKFDNRNEKGVSTKGQDRGNGLHFAKKLLSKNSWIEASQEVIDAYYIQKLSIKKLG